MITRRSYESDVRAAEFDSRKSVYGICKLMIKEYTHKLMVVLFSSQLSGKRSNTRIQVRVYCDANYYGADCNTYCVARDDSGGRYRCDDTTGNKICLAGWTGQNCRTGK